MPLLTLKVMASLLQLHGPGASIQSDHKGIDALLERPEYADFWTLKWSDVFRSNRKTIQVKGTHVFQHWLREHVARNTGFDAVVRPQVLDDVAFDIVCY